MEIEIRKAKISDAEQDIKLADSVWRTAYAHIMPDKIFDKRDADSAKRIGSFGTWGLNQNGCVDYVALEGDKVVAILHGNPSIDAHYNELDYAELTTFYILPEYQRQGLGKQLFDRAISEFKRQGYKKMAIGVLKGNINACKAYEKWGCIMDISYSKPFEKYGFTLPKIFYIYDLTNIKTDKL